MQIDEPGNFERVWFFTFAVQRLDGVAGAVAEWMDDRAAGADYLDALARVRRLGDQHATFIAQPAQGDICALLAEAEAALLHFAGALERLPAYPAAAAEAAALRREAGRCAALRPQSG